jgi:hypothetical protein
MAGSRHPASAHAKKFMSERFASWRTAAGISSQRAAAMNCARRALTPFSPLPALMLYLPGFVREPLNKSRAGATGLMRDAVLEASPQQYREYCKGLRRRNAPAATPSLRVTIKTRVCCVARLAHILDMGCAALLASIAFGS